NIAGLGVSGTVVGKSVLAGRAALCEQREMTVPAELESVRLSNERQGRTAIIAGWDGIARAVLVVADTIESGSKTAVRQLQDLGLSPVLLTGDNDAVARAVATEVGI